ncbi:hypothetical protein IKP85_03105 [bacterium]|nr:hypothetical protein [bacterium]
MIKSETIKLKLELPVTSEQVENVLKNKGLNVIRWAITEINGNDAVLTIAVNKE